ncbi:MAG: hypothetical protein ACTS2F_10250 [Thainema sp.]
MNTSDQLIDSFNTDFNANIGANVNAALNGTTNGDLARQEAILHRHQMHQASNYSVPDDMAGEAIAAANSLPTSPLAATDSLAASPAHALATPTPPTVSTVGLEHVVLRLPLTAINRLQDAQFQFVAQSDVPALAASARQLIDVLTALLAPDSGWPEDQPQTPENLLTYLLDEAQDVQAAWQRDTMLRPSERRHSVPCHLTLAALASPIIWSIAAQSPVLMQLLEGVQARIFQPGQDWQVGQIRLAVWLTVEVGAQQESLDLVAQRPPSNLLDSQTLIQVEDREFGATPTWVQRLQLELESQLAHHPLLDELLTGLDIELLLPEQSWQAGAIQLQYGLEFTPLEQQSPNWQTGVDDAQRLVQVHIQNEAWAEVMAQATAQQRFLHEMVWQAWDDDQPDQKLDPRWLVQCACWAGDEHQTSLGWSALPNPLRLRSLGYRILWSILQASYRATRLMAGVKAQTFSPQQPWQTGYIRLRSQLTIHTAKGRWACDLSTGTRLNPYAVVLDSAALIQFEQPDLSPHLPTHLVTAASLQEQLLRQLQRRSPELEGWLHGVEIGLQPMATDGTEKPVVQGRLQLELALELVPNALDSYITSHLAPYSPVVQSLP